MAQSEQLPSSLVTIRKAEAKHSSTVTEWMFELGWPIHRDFERIWLSVDYAESWVAVRKGSRDTDELLGRIMYLWPSPNYAYLAHYIVAPKYRGQGIGSMLWKHAFEKIGSDINVGIQSFGAMTLKYRGQSGFTVPGTGLHRFTIPQESFLHAVEQKLDSHCTGEESVRVVRLGQDDWPRALQLIRESQRRPEQHYAEDQFWAHYFKISGVLVYGIESNEADGNLVAFGALNPYVHGYRVGSLYAKSDELALTLVYQLIRDFRQVIPEAKEITSDIWMGVFETKPEYKEFISKMPGAKFVHVLDVSFTKYDEFPREKLQYCYSK